MIYNELRNIDICNNISCGHEQRYCPICKTGKLVEKNGKNGSFIGCSNFNEYGCRYTENITNNMK